MRSPEHCSIPLKLPSECEFPLDPEISRHRSCRVLKRLPETLCSSYLPKLLRPAWPKRFAATTERPSIHPSGWAASSARSALVDPPQRKSQGIEATMTAVYFDALRNRPAQAPTPKHGINSRTVPKANLGCQTCRARIRRAVARVRALRRRVLQAERRCSAGLLTKARSEPRPLARLFA